MSTTLRIKKIEKRIEDKSDDTTLKPMSESELRSEEKRLLRQKKDIEKELSSQIHFDKPETNSLEDRTRACAMNFARCYAQACIIENKKKSGA